MGIGNYMPDDSYGRRSLIEAGAEKGKSNAWSDYPRAVARDQAVLAQVAQLAFKDWYSDITRYYMQDGAERQRKEAWDKQRTQGIQLFTSGFISAYQETIAKKDEEARPKVQPTPQPATSTTGLTVTVIREEHTADTHSYWLRLSDPRHLDETYDAPEPLTFDFSEAGASDFGTVSSRGTAAMASSGSDAVPSSEPKWTYIIPTGRERENKQAQNKTPQSKKPRIYWGKR